MKLTLETYEALDTALDALRTEIKQGNDCPQALALLKAMLLGMEGLAPSPADEGNTAGKNEE